MTPEEQAKKAKLEEYKQALPNIEAEKEDGLTPE